MDVVGSCNAEQAVHNGTFKFLLIPEERTSGNRVSFQPISFKFALLINEGTRDGIHEIDLVREYVV